MCHSVYILIAQLGSSISYMYFSLAKCFIFIIFSITPVLWIIYIFRISLRIYVYSSFDAKLQHLYIYVHKNVCKWRYLSFVYVCLCVYVRTYILCYFIKSFFLLGWTATYRSTLRVPFLCILYAWTFMFHIVTNYKAIPQSRVSNTYPSLWTYVSFYASVTAFSIRRPVFVIIVRATIKRETLVLPRN